MTAYHKCTGIHKFAQDLRCEVHIAQSTSSTYTHNFPDILANMSQHAAYDGSVSSTEPEPHFAQCVLQEPGLECSTDPMDTYLLLVGFEGSTDPMHAYCSIRSLG